MPFDLLLQPLAMTASGTMLALIYMLMLVCLMLLSIVNGFAGYSLPDDLLSGTLRRLAGVTRTDTTIVLSTVKDTTEVPLQQRKEAER